MRTLLDFNSWQDTLSTLLGLALVTLIAVGIRLLVMQRVQQRRERQNRQINERLKTLIAAYKTLGGSFTGNLQVDPSHLRELRSRAVEPSADAGLNPEAGGDVSDRRRRIRDAVEAALSDVVLLGTADQVKLAAQAATDMVAGRHIETAALIVSLRNFIRQVLDLDAIPADLLVPKQGPLRSAAGGGTRATAGKAGSRAANAGGGRDGGGGGGAVRVAAVAMACPRTGSTNPVHPRPRSRSARCQALGARPVARRLLHDRPAPRRRAAVPGHIAQPQTGRPQRKLSEPAPSAVVATPPARHSAR